MALGFSFSGLCLPQPLKLMFFGGGRVQITTPHTPKLWRDDRKKRALGGPAEGYPVEGCPADTPQHTPTHRNTTPPHTTHHHTTTTTPPQHNTPQHVRLQQISAVELAMVEHPHQSNPLLSPLLCMQKEKNGNARMGERHFLQRPLPNLRAWLFGTL